MADSRTTSIARWLPRARRTRGLGARLSGERSPATCSASRGIIQERARELACLETLDGGKPIRESRDVDVPLARQHFFYHAGWADKLELAFPGERRSRSASSARSSPGTSRC